MKIPFPPLGIVDPELCERKAFVTAHLGAWGLAPTQGTPGCPGALPACEMKGLIWFLICMRRPRPRSTMVGKLSSLSVWPVGAVSNTTTEKFMPFTSLRGDEGQAHAGPSSTPVPGRTSLPGLTS